MNTATWTTSKGPRMKTTLGLPAAAAALVAVVAPGSAATATEAERAAQSARREEEILRRCVGQIEKNRKSDATVRVIDSAGRPVAGASIQVEQTRHDFLFGSNIYRFDRFKTAADNAAYKRRFEELLNAATVGFAKLLGT